MLSILFSDPSDYSDTFRQLRFSGNGIQSVDIPITDDSIEESIESFNVSLVVESQPQGVVILQPDSEAMVTIVDGDGKYELSLVQFQLLIMFTVPYSHSIVSEYLAISSAMAW